jgi:phage terminase small subunit
VTPKQQRFIVEYTVDLNAAAAARRAGYSSRTAEAIGSRLLRNVKVAAAVCAALAERAERADLDAEYVLRRLMAEANDRGRGSSHAGRVRALEPLGKHLRLFTDRIEMAQPVRLQIVEEIVNAPERETP